jgi:hypothetical protein
MANEPNLAVAYLSRTGAAGLHIGQCGPRPLSPRHGGPARVCGGDCTGSKEWRPVARCQLHDNGARENVARASPALEVG